MRNGPPLGGVLREHTVRLQLAVSARLCSSSTMQTDSKRSSRDWAIDVALCMIVTGSLACIFWHHLQSVQLDNLILKMIEARGREDLDALLNYRDSARVLLSGYQSWTLLGAYVCLGAGLIVSVHRRRQGLV